MKAGWQNLLAETLAALAYEGRTPADVRWVGYPKPTYPPDAAGCWTTWEAFAALANVAYNPCSIEEVASSLLVVGDDWWLERNERNDCGWWEFKRLPERPEAACADFPHPIIGYRRGRRTTRAR